jgi:hypothetical protein
MPVETSRKTCMPSTYGGQKNGPKSSRAGEKFVGREEQGSFFVPLPTKPMKEGAMTHGPAKLRTCNLSGGPADLPSLRGRIMGKHVP